MKCKFCEKPTIESGEFRLCNECHTVSFFKEITLEEKKRLILDYLNKIQRKVLERQDYLRTIEQKYVLSEYLTPYEQEIQKNMAEFQAIRLELEAYIKNGSQLCEKNERNLLYRLLILSEWLSKHFGRDA